SYHTGCRAIGSRRTVFLQSEPGFTVHSVSVWTSSGPFRPVNARSPSEGPLSAAAPIRRNAGIRKPYPGREPALLPKHVNRHAAPGIPVAGDADEFRLDGLLYTLADLERGVFVKTAGIAEACQEQLQRFGLHDLSRRRVVDDEMGE